MWHSVQALNLELASLRTGSSEPKPSGRCRSSHQTEVLDNVDDDLDRIRIVDSGTEQLPASSSRVPAQHLEGPRAQEVSAQCRYSLREVMRSAFRNQPYIAVTIAVGIGWLRMHRTL
jgi:hypothetical protein